MHLHLGADHAAIDLKNDLVTRLRNGGHTVTDHGPHSEARVDYPDFAAAVCREVAKEPGCLGILICGSGVGMSMAANKIRGIRAAHVQDSLTARLSREHNDANVLCLGARILGPELAMDCVRAWLEASFEGGRHAGRIQKIHALEEQQP